MLSFIKNSILSSKQAAIKRRFPNVNIVLHPDMPSPSVNKMESLAGAVSEINNLEPGIAGLSDAELKHKTAEFKERIAQKSKEYQQEINPKK